MQQNTLPGRPYCMLRNFFKVALRNLWKHKGYSFLNIFGLAMGMTCSLLILLWIRDERSVDAFHAKESRLYSIYERQYYDGKADAGYYTPGLLPAEMKKVIPEVEMAAGYGWQDEATFEAGTKIIKEKGSSAGVDFFSMFSYPLLQGRPATALAWWAMHVWLQNFAYHVGLEWWVFLLAGALALLIALLTVSVQAIKVAIANPVKSLRTE